MTVATSCLLGKQLDRMISKVPRNTELMNPPRFVFNQQPLIRIREALLVSHYRAGPGVLDGKPFVLGAASKFRKLPSIKTKLRTIQVSFRYSHDKVETPITQMASTVSHKPDDPFGRPSAW